MKMARGTRYALLVFISIAAAAPAWGVVKPVIAPAKTVRLTNDGRVKFLAVGRPSALRIKGEGAIPEGAISIADGKASGSVAIDLSAFTTGNETRDHHMKEKYLEVGKPEFKSALLTLTECALPASFFEGPKGEAKALPFKGKLKLHGVEKDVAGSVDLARTGAAVSGATHFDVKLSEYGIAIPSFAGITVAEDVGIDVALTGKIRMIGAAALLALFLASAPDLARAFAENIRHGYVNCTSCHASPSGGGALTAYGRELSRDIMSAWGYEGEQKFAYFVAPPENLALGGDARVLYLYQNNPSFQSGKWIYMQGDVEGYANLLSGTKQTLWIGGSAGFEKKDPNSEIYSFLDRRYWINWRPTDELSFRVGKFQADYGINVPDHTAYFKRLTGHDEGSETQNLEIAWIGANWTHFATAIFGRPDDLQVVSAEKGLSLSSGYAFWDRNRIGLSFYRGENDIDKRSLAGPFAMLSFSEKLFLLSEIDEQWLTQKGADVESRGFVNYNKLGYEAVKGVIPYVTQELAYLSDQAVSSRRESFGVGLQWLPRPHVELNMTYQKQSLSQYGQGFVDYAYLMLHWYP